MINNKWSFFLMVLFAPSYCLAQLNQNQGIEISRMQFQAKQVISPSPEAAELGKYGNVPVSLFTGTPNISIPLMELKGSILSLPISLSYNSSGFKPEDIASWVGIGWVLNSGGVITRSAIGEPDGDDNYYISPSPLSPVPTHEEQKQIYFRNIRDKVIETQPDVYYFNFMGHSGKFHIQPDGQIFKKEKDLLKIIRWWNNSGERTFIITDEQGIRYEFMETEETNIQPTDDQVGAPPMIPRNFHSAWYLSKVISPYGNEELNFEYYAHGPSVTVNNEDVKNRSVTLTRTDDLSGSTAWQSAPVLPNPNIFVPPVVTIKKKFLKKITVTKDGATLGYLDFESTNNEREDAGALGDRLLKNIKLFRTEGVANTLVRQFNFEHEYFGAHQLTTPTANYKRLKLKKVQEISTDLLSAPSKPPYEFFYNGETADMPKRFTSGLDHWGFYNGASNISSIDGKPTLIPTVSVSYPYMMGNWGEGAVRDPFPIATSLTMIEKIKYPTGGHTEFFFEGHDVFVHGNSNPLPIGGLRIQKMIDRSSTSNTAVVKTFEYKKTDGSSSGKSGVYPRYDNFSIFSKITDCPSGTDFISYTVSISPTSLFGLGSIQGSHIGYEKVTEYQTSTDNPSQSLGRTIYTYNINGFPEIDDDLGNGDLKKQEIYDAANQLLQVTENHYYTENVSYITNRILLPIQDQSGKTALYINLSNPTDAEYHDPNSCLSPPLGPPDGDYTPTTTSVITQYQFYNRDINQQRKTLSWQKQTIYDPLTNSFLTTTRNFTYGNSAHNYPTLTEETNSTGEKVFTATKYGLDYTTNCSPQMGSMVNHFSEMYSHNMMGLPIEKLQYRQDDNGTNRRYISGQLTDHKLGLPHKIYFLQTQPVITSQAFADPSCLLNASYPNYRLAATMLYDGLYNLQQESRTNDVPTTYFWGYNSRYPVAKVVGKTHTEALTSGIQQSILDNSATTDVAMRTELNKLRALSGALVTTYTYKPMVGVTSETDARGRITYYEYDGLNRLVVVRDHENKILKKLCYNYHGQAEDCVGSGDPCAGQSTSPNWQNNGAPTCEISGGNNTGYQLQLQVDMNPCSPTYNNTQTVSIYNPTACPPPSSCNTGNCPGPDKKCINGVCETGVLKIISTRRVKVGGEPDENGNIPWWWQYYCTSVYCFSDGSTSTPYEYPTSGFCTVETCL